jgi:hypothetical protein
MAHFILNLSDGDRAQALARLHTKRWALSADERHCNALAAGDRVLMHVGRPQCAFVGCATLASAFSEWQRVESLAAPADDSGGVLLTDIADWPRVVPLDDAVRRIDPDARNPYVQANAKGFRSGIVEITASEYAAVLALSLD